MTAIITIGNEILLGKTLNTNLQYLATGLADLGLAVDYAVTVRDDRQQILEALDKCWQEHEIVITTGGLGPTDDDITKNTIADYFGKQMSFDPNVWAHVQTMFSRRDMPTPEINRNQALVPEGFRVLKNERGTAPGLMFELSGKCLFALPGVPLEMKYLFATHIKAILGKKYARKPVIQRNIHTFGISESLLAERLSEFQIPQEISLAWLPQTGRVDLRLYGTDAELIDQTLNEIMETIRDYVWGIDEDTPPEVLGRLLREKNLSLAIAESCTGGLVQRLVTDVSGSSEYFKGGVVSYSNEMKRDILGVNAGTLKTYGAVSEPTAREMSAGVKELAGADIGISITGIAGPLGGSEEKPVGTVFFGLSIGDEEQVFRQIFTGDRENVRHKAAEYAIIKLIKELLRKQD